MKWKILSHNFTLQLPIGTKKDRQVAVFLHFWDLGVQKQLVEYWLNWPPIPWFLHCQRPWGRHWSRWWTLEVHCCRHWPSGSGCLHASCRLRRRTGWAHGSRESAAAADHYRPMNQRNPEIIVSNLSYRQHSEVPYWTFITYIMTYEQGLLFGVSRVVIAHRLDWTVNAAWCDHA